MNDDNDNADKPSESSRPAASAGPRARSLKSVYEKTRSGVQLASIDKVLNKVVSGLGLDRRLRENALMSLWPQVVGDALAQKSRPLFVDIERNLVVAAANGSVAQELSLMKPQLLRHLSKLGLSLNVDVKGLRLDLKHFHRDPQELQADPPPVPPPHPEAAELEKLSLSAEESASLQAMAQHLTSAESGVADNERLRQGILRCYEREMRIRTWRRLQGYPVCEKCADPTPRLHKMTESNDNRSVCPACLYSSYTLGS